MSFVVTEACINCAYTECAVVCPAGAFHAGPNMVVIDPDACMACGACAPVCPTRAIFPDTRLPPGQEAFIFLNRALAARWPALAGPRGPLPDAQRWASPQIKRHLLDI